MSVTLRPTQIRIIRCLLLQPCTVRELMFEAGCNNPADPIQHLRKDFGLDIETVYQKGLNRDGKTIYYGVYTLHDLIGALGLLEAAATASSNGYQVRSLKKTDDSDFNTKN
ncbi:hypothetical protein OS175_04485 [Marinicella sp. S1101]|uniref:hypothetical protein n=1 Tax=Marinicella marina TaxID=2996016 RepID=UPI002260E412|nr:hypothetical protein [Marinicella marina]MCX7553124.1 hypothetical protein [Marinicella marina]MDJ1138856.1 hypothetical protein [Marinicella marina]